MTRNISMPSTVFGGGVFLLLSWGFLSFCHVLQSIYSWRLVSQWYSSTKIKLMDSPNSAVFLWSSLPFSFRSPETDAFILGCWATVLLQLICVVDWVDNRESDGASAFQVTPPWPSLHVLSRANSFSHPLVLKIHVRKRVQMKYWCLTHLLLTWTSRSSNLEIMGLIALFIHCYSPDCPSRGSRLLAFLHQFIFDSVLYDVVHHYIQK